MSTGRGRRARVHVQVVQLDVPERFRVGRVEFWPAGELADLTSEPPYPAGTPGNAFWSASHEGVLDHKGATAAVSVRWDPEAADRIREEAVDQVRDAIAVLRLYKRARYPLENRSVQDFGLAGEIGNVVEWLIVTEGRRTVSTQARLVGVVGDWKFSSRDVQEYPTDRRFAYLDRVLRTPIGRRLEFQRRSLTALRVLALSSAMLRPQLQIILLATALEALLASEEGKDAHRPFGEFLRVAQRAAYLTCGQPDDGYPGRRPCFYLEAKDRPAMWRQFHDRAKMGEDPRCSAFGHAFDLLEDRNRALHEAKDTFDSRALMWHAITADDVFLRTLEWISEHAGRGLAQLDSEFQAFVRGPA
jgi:hypothetical protein